MVWRAIGYTSWSTLIRIDGTLNSAHYISGVLRPVTLPFILALRNPTFKQGIYSRRANCQREILRSFCELVTELLLCIKWVLPELCRTGDPEGHTFSDVQDIRLRVTSMLRSMPKGASADSFQQLYLNDVKSAIGPITISLREKKEDLDDHSIQKGHEQELVVGVAMFQSWVRVLVQLKTIYKESRGSKSLCWGTWKFENWDASLGIVLVP
ncbi:hypothetical protein TNCV_1847251 [Trichonephila clavipes]|nr:hypothetical protein TNCV_1847251 [Trichonephila clavipes]